jgi:hypothetical protein
VGPDWRSYAYLNQPPVDPEIACSESVIRSHCLIKIIVGGIAFSGKKNNTVFTLLKKAADIIAQLQVLLDAKVNGLQALLVFGQFGV